MDQNIDNINKIVVIIGAGVSVASGLRTFRGIDGYYKNKSPMELASVRGFREDPHLVWSWYKERMKKAFATKPNSIHYSLVKLEEAGLLSILITQNVDGLHRMAGQKKYIEIHGTLRQTHCFDNCGLTYTLKEAPDEIPVKCKCGSLQRPSVVWFGEQINTSGIDDIYEYLRNAEMIITIGTSGNVYPVAHYPIWSKERGAMFIDFNIEESDLSAVADIFVKGPAEKTVPEFVELIISKKFHNS